MKLCFNRKRRLKHKRRHGWRKIYYKQYFIDQPPIITIKLNSAGGSINDFVALTQQIQNRKEINQ